MRRLFNRMLGQPWAADRAWLEGFLRDLPELERREAGGRIAATGINAPPEISAGVAVITLAGPVLSGVPEWYADYIQFIDPAAFARQIAAAAANPDVSAIVLNVNSPGGSVVGVSEAARAVRDAAAMKPVYALANDCMASAAYWMVAGATSISATRTGVVGSVGVIAAWVDTSKAAEQNGVSYHYFRSGDEKARGGVGEPYSPELESALTHLVSATAEVFYEDVALGRGLTPAAVAERFGSGRTWVGQYAQDSGIVDQVEDLSAVVARALGAVPPGVRPAAQVRPARAALAPGGNHVTPEQLAALGLSADATPQQIQTALDARNETHRLHADTASRMALALGLTAEQAEGVDLLATLTGQAADGRAFRESQLDRLAQLVIVTEGNDAAGQKASEDAREVYANQSLDKIGAQIDRLEAKRNTLPGGPVSRRAEVDTSRPRLLDRARFGR